VEEIERRRCSSYRRTGSASRKETHGKPLAFKPPVHFVPFQSKFTIFMSLRKDVHHLAGIFLQVIKKT
jgi:hypothetical protein